MLESFLNKVVSLSNFCQLWCNGCNFTKKETAALMFFSVIFEIFIKNTFFTQKLSATASIDLLIFFWCKKMVFHLLMLIHSLIIGTNNSKTILIWILGLKQPNCTLHELYGNNGTFSKFTHFSKPQIFKKQTLHGRYFKA